MTAKCSWCWNNKYMSCHGVFLTCTAWDTVQDSRALSRYFQAYQAISHRPRYLGCSSSRSNHPCDGRYALCGYFPWTLIPGDMENLMLRDPENPRHQQTFGIDQTPTFDQPESLGISEVEQEKIPWDHIPIIQPPCQLRLQQ